MSSAGGLPGGKGGNLAINFCWTWGVLWPAPGIGAGGWLAKVGLTPPTVQLEWLDGPVGLPDCLRSWS